LIRVGLTTVNNHPLDEVVIAFNKVGSNTYNSSIDAASFNSGSQVLVTLKGSDRLAIATFPDSLNSDTSKLGVTSSSFGAFRLSFSNYEGIDTTKSITLRDKFLLVNHDVRSNPIYDFNITSDTGSQGNNRFELVFVRQNVLPISFRNLTAVRDVNIVEVKWQFSNKTSCKSFVVEKSVDRTHFSNISVVNATDTNSYQFLDSLTSNESVYYRIKAVLAEGTYIYSSIVGVAAVENVLTSMTIYPNPVKDKINISIDDAIEGTCKLSISSLEGVVIHKKIGIMRNKAQFSIDATSLSTGLYIAEFMDEKGMRFVRKFVKK